MGAFSLIVVINLLNRLTMTEINTTGTIKTIELAKGLEPRTMQNDPPVKARSILFNNLKNLQSEEKTFTKTPVLGSSETAIDTGNKGLFSTIIQCYNNHWILRTGPEDWWYTFIQKVAVAVDQNAKKESVRRFFVQHEGKKKLSVSVGPSSIYGVDYSWFFDQMSQQIKENVNVPEFVDTIQSNFSQTTKTQRIVSEITLMSSLQEYFEYEMCFLCGIPAVEMKGSEEDWVLLGTKLNKLRTLLEPISSDLDLDQKWWDSAEGVCNKLADTYRNKPDKDWWSKVFSIVGFGSGPRYVDGWFAKDVLGVSGCTMAQIPKPFVTVPMKITDGCNTEESTLIAGLVGAQVHKTEGKKSVALEPVHAWALLLEPNSSFRSDITKWETENMGA